MDTTEQIKALGFDRNISVMANAGSGKTRVLVKRFVNILLYHNLFSRSDKYLKTSEIVAITFTRKAAAEMRTKVINMVEQEIQLTTQRNNLEKLYRIREELSNARISTIHSFCSGLLKEFPIESDVNPAFIEIPAAQLNRIKKDALVSVFEDWLESEDILQKEKIEKLFLIFGRKSLEEMIDILLKKIELFENIKHFYTKSNEEITYQSIRIFAEKYLPAIRQSISNILKTFNDNSATFENKKRDSYNGIMSTAERLINFIDSSNEHNNEWLQQVYSLLLVIRQDAFTASGTLLAKLKKPFAEDGINSINQNWRKCFDLFPFFEALKETDSEDNVIESARALIKITEDVTNRIDEEKAELTALDFGDMILKVHKLLDNPEAIAKIRRKIKYLLVDEFQDTDNLQYSIITKLLPQLGNPDMVNTSGNKSIINLFIVGDPKQSIYGFRNADVRVFEKAVQDISNLNSALLNKSIVPQIMTSFIAAGEEKYRIAENEYNNEEISGMLKLTSTFRLQPVIAAFINKICNSIMKQKESEFDVDYSEFVCGRNTFEEALTEGYNSGRLGFIIKIEEKKDKRDEYNDTDDIDETLKDNEDTDEAELLARHIKSIISKKLKVEEEGVERNITYRDIAILARTRNKFQSLENALLKHRIPYILHSGRGFLNSQEVIDIIAFLNFLYNPSDDISLATILRSPFFHLSDALLFRISLNKQGKSLWEKFGSFAESKISDDVADESDIKISNRMITKRPYNILNEIIALSPVLPVSQLINAILEKTARYGTITDENKRDVIEYNINQLLEMARDFEKRSFAGFFDFVTELNFMREYGIGEAETAEITSANSVNIMTIHASKGLEFPVVYFYDSNARNNSRDTYFISGKFGFQFKSSIVKITEDGSRTLTGISTPSYILAKLENNEKLHAEDKRLLYVALSRSKDYLFITGTITQSQVENGLPYSFLELILRGLGTNPSGIIIANPSFSHEINLNRDGRINRSVINYNIDIFTEIEVSGEFSKSELKDSSGRLLLDGEITFVIEEETYSPTGITQFLSNKEEYLRKYILGLKGEESHFFIPDDDDNGNDKEEATDGTVAGSVIHSVLEKIGNWMDESCNINQNALNSVIISTFYQMPANHSKDELKARILAECANVSKTNLIKRYTKELFAARKEWELNMPIGNDFLKCIIDAVPVIDGEIEIWDWKTNRIESDEARLELAKHYELQMKIYCYFMSKYNPGQSAYKARLLFTRLAAHKAEDTDWTHLFSWNTQELEQFALEIEEYIWIIKYQQIG